VYTSSAAVELNKLQNGVAELVCTVTQVPPGAASAPSLRHCQHYYHWTCGGGRKRFASEMILVAFISGYAFQFAARHARVCRHAVTFAVACYSSHAIWTHSIMRVLGIAWLPIVMINVKQDHKLPRQ